jgi:hypothetical protein
MGQSTVRADGPFGEEYPSAGIPERRIVSGEAKRRESFLGALGIQELVTEPIAPGA